MTTQTLPAIQADLIRRLEIQEAKYQKATALIERLGTTGSVSDPNQQKDVLALQQSLSEIRTSAADVTAAVDAYMAAGNPRTIELNDALQRQESNLKSFLARINSMEQAFSGSHTKLQQQLDNRTTRRSMHQAYQQSMKTR